jgi:hypothetical protein
MHKFVQQHAGAVSATLSGWDRLRFRGTLRMLANVAGLGHLLSYTGHLLSYTGHLLKDFGSYALDLTDASAPPRWKWPSRRAGPSSICAAPRWSRRIWPATSPNVTASPPV